MGRCLGQERECLRAGQRHHVRVSLRPRDGREATVEEDNTSLRMVRGGARLDPSYVVRAANRNERPPTQSTALYGFRCVRSFDPLVVGEPVSQAIVAPKGE